MVYQIAYIEPILFLYMLSFFFTLPLEQQMVYRKECLSHFNQTFCKSFGKSTHNHSDEENLVQEEVAKWDMYNGIAKSLPSIFSTLFFGALSDGVGRKKILVIPVLGETVNVVCYFVNAWYFSAPISYLFIGNIISGISGHFPAILMCVFAYIADVSTQESRTKRITILDALIFLASFISCLGGGLMLQNCGFVSVYILVLGLYAIMITYLIFFLKESYHPQEAFKISDFLQRNKVMASLRMFSQKRDEYRHTKIAFFMGCFFILFFQIIGLSSVNILYLLHQPLNFQPSEIGYFLATGSIVKFVGSLLITVILIKRYKWQDSSLILLCSIMAIAYSLCIGLSKTQWQIYLTTILGIGLGVGNGACRSGLSKLVSTEEQGKMCSLIAIIQLISLFVATIICNSIYKYTVHITPSFTFYSIAGFTLISVLLSCLLKVYERKAGYKILQRVDGVALLEIQDQTNGE